MNRHSFEIWHKLRKKYVFLKIQEAKIIRKSIITKKNNNHKKSEVYKIDVCKENEYRNMMKLRCKFPKCEDIQIFL